MNEGELKVKKGVNMKTVIKVWALTVSVTVVFAVSAAEVTLNVAWEREP